MRKENGSVVAEADNLASQPATVESSHVAIWITSKSAATLTAPKISSTR